MGRLGFELVLTIALIGLDHCGGEKEPVIQGVGSILEAIGFSSACVSQTLALCERNATHSSQFQDVNTQLRSLQNSIDGISAAQKRPRNCFELFNGGDVVSGVRVVYPFTCCQNRPVSVFCDQTTDGGGWTRIQHRDVQPLREDFARKWNEYKLGFGNLTGEFWVGLDSIHALVSETLMELRIDLEDFEHDARWAKYDYFYITGASDKYRLDLGKYIGTAGDGFKDRHIGFPFSAKDQDNDSHGTNCALAYRGGWWYDKCHISNLNGFQYEGKHTSYADGINWHPFHQYHYSLKRTTLSIRPKFFN